MDFNLGALSHDSLKVIARILKADKKHKEYIDSICEFEDPEFVDNMFVKIGGRSLDWGEIEGIERVRCNQKEIWSIKTYRGRFKVQIINKPQWVIVDNYKNEIEDELSAKRVINKLLDENLYTVIKYENNIPWKK